MLFLILVIISWTSIFAFSNTKQSFTRFGSFLKSNTLDGNVIDGELKPMSNNLLVSVKAALESTKGGLYIPDAAQERPTEGTVIAAGPGRHHSETGFKFDMEVNCGDKVMYGKFDGTELRYNDVDRQLLKDDDVLLVYSGDECTVNNAKTIKDNILVKLPKIEEETIGGIIVTTNIDGEGSKKKPDRGQVVAVGPGRVVSNGEVIKPCVEIGDMIRFRNFAGAQISLQNEEYVVIKDHDVQVKWKQ